jgi:hypothetical protein
LPKIEAKISQNRITLPKIEPKISKNRIMVPNKFYNKGAAKPHNKNKNKTKLPKIETKISKEITENNSQNKNKDFKQRFQT